MRKLIHVNALASAVGLALVGLALQPSLDAHAAQIRSSGTAAQQPEGRATYIITFAEAGLLNYQGGTQGLAATAAAPTARSHKLDVHTPAAVSYGRYLESQRAAYIAAIEGALGRSLPVTHSYSVTLNGIAADLGASEVARIAGLPGVRSVRAAGFETQTTFRGPRFIGAGSIWDGSATPGNVGTRGQGVIVGDLDGGTNSDHPSFANDETCGFSASNPKLKAVDCSSSSGGLCNGPNPEANPGFGHGVHTSSTAAGNTIDNTFTPPPALPDGISMSGVAPCATLYHYKVCATNSCSGASILAGIQNAITDQVDVLNFSISGGTSPWSDNDRGFLDMVHADVFVAAAAGNLQAGETDPTGLVNHLGPWVMSVAASTQDEVLSPVLNVTGPGTPPATVTGVPLIPGSTTTSTPSLTGIPIASYPTNVTACTADGGIAAGTFTGKIAVLRRGTCSFTEKITNAAGAGAVLVVIGNNQVGSISMDTTGAPAVPAYSVDQGPGDALIAYLGEHPSDAVADTIPSGIGSLQGDVLASFSYRGPTPSPLADLTKPDISGPGVNIYAAFDDQENNYGLDSGTSMSTPHITGSGALVRAVHPDWTPMEVKSAMQMTATNATGMQEDGVTPWTIDQVGSGRVDLTKAALAGLTLDETYANFLAANPSGGSVDVKDLNLPSLRNLQCAVSCAWTRTFTNKLATAGSWSTSFQSASTDVTVTATPATFTVAAGATQDVTFTATPAVGSTITDIAFGEVVLHEANGLSPDQHLSVAIKGAGGTEVDEIFANGFEGSGGGGGGISYSLDDGTYENAISWTDGDPVVEYASVFLNRFTPDAADYPLSLSDVQIMWPNATSGGGDLTGKSGTVLVYVDADSDGNPANAMLVGQANFTIAGPDAFETYPTSIEIPGPGDLYIGFQDTWATGGLTPALYAAALDQNSTVAGRSWVAANLDNSTPDLENLGNNTALGVIGSGGTFGDASLAGNWLIRADAVTPTGKQVSLR